ncbi:MAG TPA: NAD(P)/FAD-dependent oxidoreductase [Pseudomonadales bacterium]|nr:NAD(P)/FAD-dependent oxidoreductase [Pseudomonadales bacterium]
MIIAGGVGSFQPVQVEVPGIDRLLDHSLFYRVKDPARHHGKRLLVVGGGDSALDWTLSLCDQAQSLTLIHRRNEFRAQPNSVNQMHELCAAGKMNFKVAVVADFEADGTQLKRVALKSGQGEPEWIECDHILALLGLTPNLGPIGEWGLEIVRKQVVVDTEKFQTNVPGIFAVGDINSYPGKKKLILSGFHETALAAFAIKERLQPGKKVHLQYTTTSPALQERLGVRGSDGETSTQ